MTGLPALRRVLLDTHPRVAGRTGGFSLLTFHQKKGPLSGPVLLAEREGLCRDRLMAITPSLAVARDRRAQCAASCATRPACRWSNQRFLSTPYPPIKRAPVGARFIGGERGIRTLDRILSYTPLAGARLRPLGHLSGTLNYHLLCSCRSIILQRWSSALCA